MNRAIRSAAGAAALLAVSAAATPREPAAVFRRLASRYWEEHLAAHPVAATFLGYRQHDGSLPDPTPAGRRARERALAAIAGELQAISPEALPEAERISWLALREEVDGERARLECDLEAWTLDPLEGPQVVLQRLPVLQTVETVAQGRALVERYRRVEPFLDASRENLLRALGQGKMATRSAADRVSRQLDALLARPTAEWALLAPLRAPHPDWPPEALGRFRADLEAAVRRQVRPALERYAETVTRTILPVARSDAEPGIGGLPGGAACYRRLVRMHTGLPAPAEEIHALGLEEVRRIGVEMRQLGERLFGTADLAATLDRLRRDPALRFSSREEVESAAREAMDRARRELPRLVGRPPAAACEVRRVEAHEERDTTMAYYREPAADGSRPGTYFVNTFAPESRPRYEAEALAFHESIPGHHVQIALAQERRDLPAFRRHLGSTALVEGWALYVERLADEVGLYRSDLDRMGMLSFDAWRAGRLVVDTGIHALGWSRERAMRFLRSHTALAEENIANEVDRYIVWPGQALAYKMGEREIRALRREAEAAQGDRFDLRAFHDQILAEGAVPLPVLRQRLQGWLAGAGG